MSIERLTPSSPCRCDVSNHEDGGLTVTIKVPTYQGGTLLSVSVSRDEDGDWRVNLPWPDLGEPIPDDGHGPCLLPGGHEIVSGLGGWGAPDAEIEADWQPA